MCSNGIIAIDGKYGVTCRACFIFLVQGFGYWNCHFSNQVCNFRDGGDVYNATLDTVVSYGCEEAPHRSSPYCLKHLSMAVQPQSHAAEGSSSQAEPPLHIVKHRKVQGRSEYLVSDSREWLRSGDVADDVIRRYEMQLLT